MKDVQGYEGHYCVDELGNIYSVKRGKARRLRPFLNSRGYPTVSLCVNGKESYKTVHRLVATAFIPNRDNLPQVNHINGDKTDNRIENLEWVTAGDNQRHAYATGLKVPVYQSPKTMGRAVIRSDGAIFDSIRQAARATGCDHKHVSEICRGKGPNKTANGYSFAFLEGGASVAKIAKGSGDDGD